MQEYRWLFSDSTARLIAADRGRFLTDDDAVRWAVRLMNESPAASQVEIWRDARLVERRLRACDAASDEPRR